MCTGPRFHGVQRIVQSVKVMSQSAIARLCCLVKYPKITSQVITSHLFEVHNSSLQYFATQLTKTPQTKAVGSSMANTAFNQALVICQYVLFVWINKLFVPLLYQLSLLNVHK